MVLVNILMKVNLTKNKEDHFDFTESEVPVEITWEELLQRKGVFADSSIHYMKGAAHSAFLNEKIEKYYKKFNRQLRLYKVTLICKPTSLMKYEKELNDAIRISLNSHAGPSSTSSSSSSGVSNEMHRGLPPPKEYFTVVQKNCPPPPPPANLISNFNYDNEVHMPVQIEENTQEGNIVPDGIKSITDRVRSYLQNRISNRDIMEVRRELIALKAQEKYFHLTRIASFTAGFLENVFLQGDQNQASYIAL